MNALRIEQRRPVECSRFLNTVGFVLQSVGFDEEASRCYGQAMGLQPANMLAASRLVALLMAGERYQQAIEVLVGLLNIHPGNVEFICALGMCYFGIGEYVHAVKLYHYAAMNGGDQRFECVFGLGLLFEKTGASDRVGVLLQDAYRLSRVSNQPFSKSAVVAMHAVEHCRKLQDFEGAELILRDLSMFYEDLMRGAASTTPSNKSNNGMIDLMTQVQLQLAQVLEMTQRAGEAKAIYERLVSEELGGLLPLIRLALLLFTHAAEFDGANSRANAFELLRRANEKDPSSPKSWLFLGRCHFYNGDFSLAHECYNKALVLDQGDPEVWAAAGVLHFSQGRNREALESFGQAIQICPYLAEVWWMMGVLYKSCGQDADSQEAFAHVLALNVKI